MNQINFQTGIVELDRQGAPVTKGDDMERFKHVEFPTPFPEGSTVGVVPMTQTFHGPDTPGLRIAHVTTTGFKIRMNELVHSWGGKENQALSDGQHLKEKVAWIAFTKGAAQVNSGPPHHHPHHQLWHGTLEANNQQGAHTGVILHEGDVISITAKGKANFARSRPDFGPDGDTTRGYGNAMLPSANGGALLMRIGTGPLKFVGADLTGYVVSAEEDNGEIVFLYNDEPGEFGDNTGSFEITLSKK